jgi:hypothetical protein
MRVEQIFDTLQNLFATIPETSLSLAKLEYLTGLAEGIKLARQEPEIKKEEEGD